MQMRYKEKRFNFSQYHNNPILDRFKTIKILKHNPEMPDIEKIEKGDWIDLRVNTIKAIYDKGFNISKNGITSYFDGNILKIWKGFTYVFDLGVSMELPEGYEAHVLPRSSTFKNTGLILGNEIGVIDHDYKGDADIWIAVCFATRNTEIELKDYPRLFQFRIVEKMPTIRFNYVESLGNESRGGHGSTGRV